VNAQPFLIGEGWMEVLDGNLTAEALYRRHYSRRPGERKKRGLIVGPGEKMVLLWHDARALFAWRKELFRADDQLGVNCAVFRNEGAGSELIRAADALAWRRWPGERLFTFVDGLETFTRRSRHAPPGACFIHAGWRPCGQTKGGLAILERLP
jgi:hypothetical protein